MVTAVSMSMRGSLNCDVAQVGLLSSCSLPGSASLSSADSSLGMINKCTTEHLFTPQQHISLDNVNMWSVYIAMCVCQ